MTSVFYLIIGCITFVAFLHAMTRKDYDLNRTVVISRPRPEVFAYIRQLQKQKNWVPWIISNPETVLKFRGEDGQIGASLYWMGKNTGEGIEKITKIKDGKILETELLFLKPRKRRILIYMAVKELGEEKTKMIWGIRGMYSFPQSVFNLLPGMEYAMEKKMEEGLYNLRLILESRE